MKAVNNLDRLSEDERIMLIGEQARSMLVGMLIENDPAKIQRYITKLTMIFPDVRHVDTHDGPAKGMALVRFAPKVAN